LGKQQRMRKCFDNVINHKNFLSSMVFLIAKDSVIDHQIRKQ